MNTTTLSNEEIYEHLALLRELVNRRIVKLVMIRRKAKGKATAVRRTPKGRKDGKLAP